MRGGDSANSTNDAMHWFARSQQLTTRIPIIIICMTICLVQCDDDNAQMHRCITPTVYSCELALTQPKLLTEIKFNLTLNGINIIAAFYMWLMHELLRARSKCGRVLRDRQRNSNLYETRGTTRLLRIYFCSLFPLIVRHWNWRTQFNQNSICFVHTHIFNRECSWMYSQCAR